MEEEARWRRLRQEVDALDYGAATFTVKLLDDGKWLVTLVKTKRCPTIPEMHELIDTGKEWGFGGVAWKDGESRNLLFTKELRI